VRSDKHKIYFDPVLTLKIFTLKPEAPCPMAGKNKTEV